MHSDHEIVNRRRSRSSNSLVFSVRKRNAWDTRNINRCDTQIFSDNDKDLVQKKNGSGWDCEKCYRLNETEFKFCPNCGEKRPLHAVKKVEIYLYSMELKEGSDTEEMDESDSDHDDLNVL